MLPQNQPTDPRFLPIAIDGPYQEDIKYLLEQGIGEVNSFNGRVGTVVPVSGDYTAALVTNAADKSAAGAQTFTGNVSAPALIAAGLTGATAASRYVGATASGAPASGAFLLGDFIIDQTGVTWICTTAGSPGTWESGGGVDSVTAGSTAIVIGGTSAAPTVDTNTLDVIATQHPPAANWSNNSFKITSLAAATASTDAASLANRLDQFAAPTASVGLNSQKITSLANGTAASDAAAFGQIPTSLPPNGTAGGDLTGSYPNPTVTSTANFKTQVETVRLDQMAAPTAAVSLNSQKITSLANGSAASDGAAFGQIPALATNAIVLGTSAAAGAATTTLRSNDTIAAFDATVPGNVTPGATAATGSIAFAARRDHTHGTPALALQTTVATSETTTSTSYTGLTTPGAVTITTGTRALVTVTARASNSGVGGNTWMSFAVSGATTLASSDTTSMQWSSSVATTQGQLSATYLVTLTAGSNTFTSQFRVDAGTGTWANRNILVQPLN